MASSSRVLKSNTFWHVRRWDSTAAVEFQDRCLNLASGMVAVLLVHLPAAPKLDQSPMCSAVRDHDLPEMPATLEMPIGCLSLGEGKCLVDNRA